MKFHEKKRWFLIQISVIQKFYPMDLIDIKSALVQVMGWYKVDDLNQCWSTHCLIHIHASPGGRFNIKMTSYQYRKSHCGDKTILQPSYLHNGISYTGKITSLYWIRAQASIGLSLINPLHAKFFSINTNMQWQFLFFLHSYRTQIDEILSYGNLGPTYFS